MLSKMKPIALWFLGDQHDASDTAAHGLLIAALVVIIWSQA